MLYEEYIYLKLRSKTLRIDIKQYIDIKGEDEVVCGCEFCGQSVGYTF